MSDGLRFARDHEWARPEGPLVRVGISDYAQDALGDIVFLDLPKVGRRISVGEVVGEVESTKTVSTLVSPLSGEVVEVNQALAAQPETVNSDPYGAGWMFVVRPSAPSELDALMDEVAYRAYVEEISR